MFYCFFALGCFLLAVTLHVIYCRYSHVSGLHSKVFIMIAGFCLGVYVLGAFFIVDAGFMNQASIWGLPFVVSSGAMYVLFIPTYLTFYVLTQLMSPSKKILLMLQKKNVLSFEDVVQGIKDEDFIGTRMKELCQSGCVIRKDNHFVLSASGASIAMILNVMQVLLGREAGG